MGEQNDEVAGGLKGMLGRATYVRKQDADIARPNRILMVGSGMGLVCFVLRALDPPRHRQLCSSVPATPRHHRSCAVAILWDLPAAKQPKPEHR